MKNKLTDPFLNAMSKEPANWKGPIYFNPKDPRIMVPKINPSLGSTLNFASPYAYLTLGAIVVIAVVVKLLA